MSWAFALSFPKAQTTSRCLTLRRSSAREFASTARIVEASAGRGLPPVPENAHRIVLMRHGESEFNNANIFTGWCDVALTQRGIVEAVEAGEVFRSQGLTFRKCYSSMLTRSIVTAQRALEAAGLAYTPLKYDWQLNERHYGALQGLSKERTADRLGRKLVMEWRRSFEARPPLMTNEHPHYKIINEDPRYVALNEQIPLGESLEDCQHRVVRAWKEILHDFHHSASEESDYTLIVAHANSLRALVMYLDEFETSEIEGLNIPTAIPFYYDIDKTTGKVVAPDTSGNNDKAGDNSNDNNHFRGTYISDERKKRNFLERQRAANDPWLWALHDHQVAQSMLVSDDNDIYNDEDSILEGLDGVEEEAKHNTEVFSSALQSENVSIT
jgi:2,3-bisphosphoglycerate-dependent phosphoglycerate mutase